MAKKPSGGKQNGHFRSAISGKIVTKEYADKNPSTTVHEKKPREPKPPTKSK